MLCVLPLVGGGGYGGFNLQLHSPPLCLLEPEPSAGHLLKSGPIRTPSQSGHIECPCRLCKAVVKAGNPLQLLLQQPSSGGQDVPRCTQHKNKQFLIQHGACSTLVVLAEAGKLQKQSAVVPLHQPTVRICNFYSYRTDEKLATYVLAL